MPKNSQFITFIINFNQLLVIFIFQISYVSSLRKALTVRKFFLTYHKIQGNNLTSIPQLFNVTVLIKQFISILLSLNDLIQV